MPRPTRFCNRLAGRVAIVTGAGSPGDGVGTGRAISLLFAREGARVCLVDREAARAEETRAMIANAGGEAFVCTGDVTISSDCARFVAATLERYGGVNILVNNVGIATGSGRLDRLDEAQWDRVLGVNLKSVVLMTRHAVAPMIAAGGGSIVNISSTAGLRAHGTAAYGPSKAAIVALSRDLAVMYGRDGIRVNTVAPGHIFTPMVAAGLDDRARTMRRKVAPLGVEGDAWDVASTALFLASDEARFVSGVCIPVDGGVTQVSALTGYDLIND